MEPAPTQEIPQSKLASKNLLVSLLVIIVILIIGAAGYYFLKVAGEKQEEGAVITGLEVDSVTIGQPVAVAGIFPDSAPEFNDVVFNNNIFDGLGRIVNGKVEPALVSSWTNPDNLTWRFKLREGVRFHNGEILTVEDVKFSIDTALKEEWPNSFNLGTVEAVKIVDDLTFEVVTSAPDPVLLNRLVFAFVVSQEQYESKEEGENAIGTGPYKLTSLNEKTAVLELNEGYYLGLPKVKRVVYKFLPDDITDEELVAEVTSGSVDLVKITDETLAGDLGSEYQSKSLADPFIAFLWLDSGRKKSPYVSKNPNPLQSKEVRQAIYEAININEVIKQASLSAVPASQYVTDAIFGYNPNIQRATPNTSSAKERLKEAGVEDGFSLTIDLPGYLKPVGDAIASQLSKVGIKVEVNSIADRDEAFTKWWDDQDTSAYILDYGAETYDAGEIFTSMLHSPGENLGDTNYLTISYSNEEIDKLGEEISALFDTKKRSEKLQETMAQAVDDMPMIPLYSQKFTYVFANDLDWTPTAFGAIYPTEISGRSLNPQ